MRRDLNYFSKYHVAPAKTSPLKLAAISGFTAIVTIMILLIGYFQFSSMHYQSEIDRAEQILKSPELAQELKSISETESKIATVKNDQALFGSLEGDFRRLHRVNKAFMDFLNKNVTRDLVFDEIKINKDNVEIVGSAHEQLSIAKFEEELRKSDKFNHIFVDNITREEKDNSSRYVFNIKILTKDVDFNEEQK
ncbi:PilN domain-containing protein [Streptococcus sp. DD11]|uniref:PilN domain-containing protein n=1 Tax=Streptococcus sp. DD11 TaxID=1777879 RepID=UPI00100807E5